MAEAIFDGDGKLTNLEELTTEEVAVAYSEKNREIFERAKQAEAKEKEALAIAAKAKQDLESKVPKQEPEELGKIKETVSQLQLAEKKRQFGYDNGLSPDETDAVFRINVNPTKDTLQEPFVQGGLEAIRSKRKLSDNIPGSSSTSVSFAADKNLEDMKPEEKQAQFEKFMAAKFKK